MVERVVPVSRFKAECLGLVDEVASTGARVLVTKRGRPVARVIPVEPPPPLAGSVTYHVSDEALIAPIDEEWDANG